MRDRIEKAFKEGKLATRERPRNSAHDTHGKTRETCNIQIAQKHCRATDRKLKNSKSLPFVL